MKGWLYPSQQVRSFTQMEANFQGIYLEPTIESAELFTFWNREDKSKFCSEENEGKKSPHQTKSRPSYFSETVQYLVCKVTCTLGLHRKIYAGQSCSKSVSSRENGKCAREHLRDPHTGVHAFQAPLAPCWAQAFTKVISLNFVGMYAQHNQQFVQP
mmetsp:Transcript_27713/g.50564  ORF Transcript_27713/g.50564 Transcript_27713/m.50564 type:complete len:157 (+) Transcript_27713:236-706(+)